VLEHTDRFLRAAWFDGERIAYEPAPVWTDEFLDWDAKADSTRPRELRPSGGWITIRAGVARGPLFGGCLETICWHVKGSTSWVAPEGAVFLIEMSEEAPAPAYVDSYLTDLEQLGVFAAASGLIVARPYGYDAESRERLWEVVAQRTEAAGIPVLADVEAGHADPMVTLPFGVAAELDAGSKSLRLLEAPTA
jgi:muramoyltetrapeptide carboxypeptidase LdcA involved in peptidoglycan recycling